MTPAQRVFVGLGAAITGFIDPSRGDMIALLGELTGGPALQRMQSQMLASEEGRRLLEEQPRIRTQHVTAAKDTFQPGSFGAEYVRYLERHGFSPDERAEVRFVQDPSLAYVMTRYREVHDLWHVLAGLPPTVLGETAVKWLELVQTGLPMAALSALVAPARLSSGDRATLLGTYVPWAVSVGRSCVPLLTVRYEDRWHRPLEEVRKELRITPAPEVQGSGRYM